MRRGLWPLSALILIASASLLKAVDRGKRNEHRIISRSWIDQIEHMPNQPDSPDQKAQHENARPPDFGRKESTQSKSSDTETHAYGRQTQIIFASAFTSFINWWNRDRVLNLLTFLIFCTTIVYTVYSRRQWMTMQRQLDLSERPWIAFQDFRLAQEPYWEILRLPRIMGGKELRTFINLHVRVEYMTSNSGKSPAVKTFSNVQALPTKMGKYYAKPTYLMLMACGSAENQSKEANTSELYQGQAIFPTAPVQNDSESIYGLSEGTTTIDQVWMVACIAYQESYSSKIYHTKLWFLSVPKDATAKPVPIANGQTITWRPIDHFVLMDSEAD